MNRIIGIIIFCFYLVINSFSQQVVLSGWILDEDDMPLPGAYIRIIGKNYATTTSSDGSFSLQIDRAPVTAVEISFIGYRKDTLYIETGGEEFVNISHKLTYESVTINEVVVTDWRRRISSLNRIEISKFDLLPVPSGNVEHILTTFGASSRNELSNQYSVRGGSFDENLIYVNDIEIYRPLLVKSAQQEGLGFVNSSMVSSVAFSSGGFEARYGDKMSSVLDVRYKEPSEFGGNISAGMLGASLQVEGLSKKLKLTHISGIRYKTNQYLLNTLPVKGDYKPRFLDLQTYITLKPAEKIKLSLLGNLTSNHYNLIPGNRSTSFGTYQEALNFTVYYEGQEDDRFETLQAAFAVDYYPSDKLYLKWLVSGFKSNESVTADIIANYRIDVLDNTIGSVNQGDSLLNLGIGGSMKHIRNFLVSRIGSVSHLGSYSNKNYFLNWGFSFKYEEYDDKIRQWEMIDSAGYFLPYTDIDILPYSFINASNFNSSFRLDAFMQQTSTFNMLRGNLYFNSGVRLLYNHYNNKVYVSPRIRLTFEPENYPQLALHTAAGVYLQPPVYKELRDPAGEFYNEVKMQSSFHYLLGLEYIFEMWDRPFSLNTEIFYKQLRNTIPFYSDNMEIKYLPQYNANGYAVGIDLKINGEFVKDAESWASVSIMKAKEDRIGDLYGYYPRPTDQLVNFGLFFQDYLPNNPGYRFYLLMYYGSRLPYSSPDNDNPGQLFRLRAYRRVDIGLSKSLFTGKNGEKKQGVKNVKDIWLGLEVFNLFGFQNQASYQWVRTVNNQDGLPNIYAVPDYLTGRLVNIKLTAKF